VAYARGLLYLFVAVSWWKKGEEDVIGVGRIWLYLIPNCFPNFILFFKIVCDIYYQ
jgi:hypothetical protein